MYAYFVVTAELLQMSQGVQAGCIAVCRLDLQQGFRDQVNCLGALHHGSVLL